MLIIFYFSTDTYNTFVTNCTKGDFKRVERSKVSGKGIWKEFIMVFIIGNVIKVTNFVGFIFPFSLNKYHFIFS